MRIFLIFFSIAILIAIADGQRKPNITKPVTNFEKRPRPLWHRPPEERRKLSIFPRNNLKFIVTPKSVKNDDEAKEGLPTKRPLMRKFVMQDKDEKGTWSFAPRKPLMKTQRFTVTLAPPKFGNHKAIDEMKSEESKKIQTVITNVTQAKSSKTHNLNRGNLIEIVTLKQDLTPSKNLNKIETNLTKADILQTAKINEKQNAQFIEMNDNKTLPTFGESLIDVRSFNDDGITLDDDKTIIKDGQISLNDAGESLNTDISEDLIESGTVNLSEMKFTINQNDNHSMIKETKESIVQQRKQALNSNYLEILLEKIVNNTQPSNISSVLDIKDNGTLLFTTIYNENSTIHDIPQIDATKPNTFYNVMSLGHKDSSREENLSTVSFIYNTTNNETGSISEAYALNDKNNFAAHVSDTLVMGNVNKNKEEIKLNYHITEEHMTSSPINDEIISPYTEDEHPTQSPKEYNKTDSKGSDSHDLSLEIYESNMPLSGEEISTECDDYDCNVSTLSKLNLTMEETSNEQLIDNPNSSSLEEITNTSSSDNFNYYAEERSDESLIDESKDIINEQLSSESYSSNAGDELSKESLADVSNDLDKEISSESSNNFTAEQYSNESSSNTANEELSNESYYADKSNNLTEEISSDSNDSIVHVEQSNHFSGQQISNESSSKIAEEEISNESYLADYISRETIEISNDFTAEKSSYEFSSNISDGEIMVDDISRENIEILNNFSVEQIPNESSSNISNESYLTNDIPEKIINNYNYSTAEQTRNELSSNLSSGATLNDKDSAEKYHHFTETLIDNIDVRLTSDEPALSTNDESAEEIAEEALINRFKRSINIIEEEIIQTTVSGFKYTNENQLNHDLSYKNINA